MKRRFPLLLFFVLFVCYLLISFSDFGKITNLKSLDIFRSSHPAHPDIVILAIDNKSLDKLGRWPWKRTVHGQILDKLATVSPQIVVFDITFSDKETEGNDGQLAASMRQAKFPIVLASQAIFVKGEKTPREILKPLSQFQSNMTSLGSVNIFLDEDGIVRRFPEAILAKGEGVKPISFVVAEKLNVEIPQGEQLVNFAGPAGSFQTYSIVDLLNNTIPKENLSGKIIFVGATASDLRDTLLIPGRRQVLPGVEYHANVLDNLLLNRSISVLPRVYELTIGGLLFILFLLLWWKLPGKAVSYALIGIIFLLPVISFVLWQLRFSLFFFINISLIAMLFASHSIYSWYKSEKEKRVIKERFQSYFSPQIMQEILKNPQALKLGGAKREITVLFSDIRGFTAMSEKLSPESLTGLLHKYFGEMTEEILATDGVVDKFIGDAIMAFWGAPIDQQDQADQAVKAAVNMQKRVKAFQQYCLEKGLPEIVVGIGINTGVATVGNMGSEKRFDYTVIGDEVNLASRIEGLTKEYKEQIIISENTKKQLKEKVRTHYLGEVIVRGKTKAVKIYSIDT